MWSCDICQKTVDRGRIRPALLPLPLIGSPFERVAVDLIGSIETQASEDSRYILTMVDFVTRWLKTVPLSNIETSTVAEAFMVFCRIGIPNLILRDRGSHFSSMMMYEVLRLKACKGLRTTPYHPMCNVLCERFNDTLKKCYVALLPSNPRSGHDLSPLSHLPTERLHRFMAGSHLLN